MNPIFIRCAAFLQAQRSEAYVVGGAVRDALLRRPCHDYDFVVARDALKLGRALADELGGAFYPLDEERETARIVMPTGSVIDIALMRGDSIAADLAARDFTFNAMAWPVQGQDPSAFESLKNLIDPYDGEADALEGLVRVVHAQAFADDPVRLLRAVRLAYELDFQITPDTRAELQRHAPTLAQPSRERVRDELVKILSVPNTALAMEELSSLGLLAECLPQALWDQARFFRLDHLDQMLMALPHTPLVFEAGRTLLQDNMMQAVTGGHTHALLLKLAALYDDAETCAHDLRRLKFSRHALEYVQMLLQRRDAFARLTPPLDALSAHRFFRNLGAAAFGLIVWGLAWSDAAQQATQAANPLLRYYADDYARVIAPKPLLNGAELAERFGLQGAQIGQGLRALIEAQVSGIVRSVAEAEAWVEQFKAQTKPPS